MAYQYPPGGYYHVPPPATGVQAVSTQYMTPPPPAAPPINIVPPPPPPPPPPAPPSEPLNVDYALQYSAPPAYYAPPPAAAAMSSSAPEPPYMPYTQSVAPSEPSYTSYVQSYDAAGYSGQQQQGSAPPANQQSFGPVPLMSIPFERPPGASSFSDHADQSSGKQKNSASPHPQKQTEPSETKRAKRGPKVVMTPAGVPQDIWKKIQNAKTFSSYTEAGMMFQTNNDAAVQGVPILGGQYVAEIECRDDSSLAPVYYCRICPKVMPFSRLKTHLSTFSHRMKYLELHFPEKKSRLPDEHSNEVKTRRLFRELLDKTSFEIIASEGIRFPELKLDISMTAHQMLNIWTKKECEREAPKQNPAPVAKKAMPNSEQESNEAIPMDLSDDFDYVDPQQGTREENHKQMMANHGHGNGSGCSNWRQQVLRGTTETGQNPAWIQWREELRKPNSETWMVSEPEPNPQVYRATSSGYSDGLITIPAYLHQKILDSRAIAYETDAKDMLTSTYNPIVGANQVAEILPDRQDFQPIYFCRICPNFSLLSQLKEHLTSNTHKIAYIERFHSDKCQNLQGMTNNARKVWLDTISWQVVQEEQSIPYPTLRLDYKLLAKDIIPIWGERQLLRTKEARSAEQRQRKPSESRTETAATSTTNAVPNVQYNIQYVKDILALCHTLPGQSSTKSRQKPAQSPAEKTKEAVEPAPTPKKKEREIRQPISTPEIVEFLEEIRGAARKATSVRQHSQLDRSQVGIQSQLANCDNAILGGKYLVEFVVEPRHRLPVYYCKLCDKLCKFDRTLSHLVSNRHRMKFMKECYHDHYVIMKNQSRKNRANFMETVCASIQTIEDGPLFPDVRAYGYPLTTHKLSIISLSHMMFDVIDFDEDDGLSCSDDEKVGDETGEEEATASKEPVTGAAQAASEPTKPVTETRQRRFPQKPQKIQYKEYSALTIPQEIGKSFLQSKLFVCETEAKAVVVKSTECIIGAKELVEIECQDDNYFPIYYCRLCQRFLLFKGLENHLIWDVHRRQYIRGYKGELKGRLETIAKQMKLIESEVDLPTLRAEYRIPAEELVKIWNWHPALNRDGTSVPIPYTPAPPTPQPAPKPQRSDTPECINMETKSNSASKQTASTHQPSKTSATSANDSVEDIDFGPTMHTFQSELVMEKQFVRGKGLKIKLTPVPVPESIYKRMQESARSECSESEVMAECRKSHVCIGLCHLVEFNCSAEVCSPLYWCKLCDSLSPLAMIRNHIAAKRHRINHLESNYPDKFSVWNQININAHTDTNMKGKELDKMCKSIEAEEKDKMGFILVSDYRIPAKIALKLFGPEAMERPSKDKSKKRKTFHIPCVVANGDSGSSVATPEPSAAASNNAGTPVPQTQPVSADTPSLPSLSAIDDSAPPPGVDIPNVSVPPPAGRRPVSAEPMPSNGSLACPPPPGTEPVVRTVTTPPTGSHRPITGHASFNTPPPMVNQAHSGSYGTMMTGPPPVGPYPPLSHATAPVPYAAPPPKGTRPPAYTVPPPSMPTKSPVPPPTDPSSAAQMRTPDEWTNECDAFLSKIGALPKDFQKNFLPPEVVEDDGDGIDIEVIPLTKTPKPPSEPAIPRTTATVTTPSRSTSTTINLQEAFESLSQHFQADITNDAETMDSTPNQDKRTVFFNKCDASLDAMITLMNEDVLGNVVDYNEVSQPVELTLCSVLNYGHRPTKQSVQAQNETSKTTDNIKDLILKILAD